MEKNELELTIITGMSGAGKSQALHCFEDIGYFAIDNLPPQLIRDMAKLGSMPGSHIKKIAVVSDVRGGELFEEMAKTLEKLTRQGVSYQILFLDASDETLIKRFKETRRRHPLAKDGRISDGIEKERAELEKLKGQADLIIDTSEVSPVRLRKMIYDSFIKERQTGILITVVSFGYKYGMPLDADLVMDVRFLPNPHYVPQLKSLTGEDRAVSDFVLKRDETAAFIKKFEELILLLMPYYIAEGKSHLTIAIGCTGGTHRSVAISREITDLMNKAKYKVTLRHKDLGKDIHLRKEAEELD